MESRREGREQRNEERRGDFKKGVTGEDATEKRMDEREKLRKEKREKLMKRVRRAQEPNPEFRVYNKEQVSRVMVGLQTGSPGSRSEALKALCELTSCDDPHLDVLHKMRVVQVLQKILTGSLPQDQYNALWCLTNLASGTHETTAPLLPVLPYVVELLAPTNPQLADQAAWFLGNIAGDCSECRAKVAACGASDKLITLLKLDGPSELLVTLGFTLCNLLRGNEKTLKSMMSKGLLALVLRLLTPVQPMEVVIEMSWVLTYITAFADEFKAGVLAMGGSDLVAQLLAHGNNKPLLLVPLLRTVGNLANGPEVIVFKLLETKGLLQYLWNMLGTNDVSVLKELCWALGSIAAGPPQASLVLVKSKFIPPLAALFNGSYIAVRKEVGFLFLSMCSALRQSPCPIFDILANTPGVMSSFIEFINLPDEELISMGLRWASMVLKHLPQGKHLFESNGGVTALEDLEYNVHKSEALFSKANRLLDLYFTDDYDPSEDANNHSSASWAQSPFK